MTSVTLAVYDLTQGMAAVMSEGILGERIDGIWHTGICAFGIEWFFGGGIQTLPVGVFEQTRGLPVSRLDEMGVTTKTEAELRSFILTLHNRFNVQTYNLLTNNCNNFSDEICKFLCGHGISPDVIELPNRIFSTPNGAMLRPMVESMSNNINGFPHTMDPFANMSGTSSSQNQSQAGLGPGGTFASAGTSANVGGSNFSFGSAHNSSMSSAYGSSNSRSIAQGTEITEATGVVRAHLQSDYLVSAAVQGYDAMGKRLLKIVGEGRDGGENAEMVIRSIMTVLAGKLDSSDGSGGSDSGFTIEQYALLMTLATSHSSAQSAAFFLLRLMVPYTASDLPFAAGAGGGGDDDVVSIVILPLLSMLQEAATSGGGGPFPAPFKNVSSLVFGLITMSNWCSEDRVDIFEQCAGRGVKVEEGLVDVSMTFMHSEKEEIRQIASALCHNLTLRRTSASASASASATVWINDDPAALATQILCGALEEVTEEKDALVRKRRLAIALLIVRASQPTTTTSAGATATTTTNNSNNNNNSNGNAAAQMILDLGFDTVIAAAGTTAGALSRTGGREDAGSEATVCRELLSYLRPTVRATAGSNPVVQATALSSYS